MEIESYIILTDQQLVQAAIEGDSVAFEHLFNRYRGSIYQIYVSRVGSDEDTDDLLQDTFIKVYLNLHQYNDEYSFGQWVYTIARNTFIDYMRRRRDDLSIDDLQPGNAPNSSFSPEDSVINSQQRAQLDHHLGRMKPSYRRLIDLRFFKEYSYEEIAKELAMPLGTVKTQIHRAREQLCRYITESSDILS